MSNKKIRTKVVDYEKLGRAIAGINDTLIERKILYRTAFMKGIFSGLGGVVGATIVVALLLWTLSLFSEVPFIGEITDSVKNTIDSTP